MSVFILLSSVTFLVLLDVWDLQSTESTANTALLSDRINTRVSITATSSTGACDAYSVNISNPGKTYISDFSETDVIADYQDVGGGREYRRLSYVTGAVGDNEWALNSITPDSLDPQHLEPRRNDHHRPQGESQCLRLSLRVRRVRYSIRCDRQRLFRVLKQEPAPRDVSRRNLKGARTVFLGTRNRQAAGMIKGI